MRKINKHIVHCSDTPDDRDVTAEDIRKWHTDPKPKGNGWDDIGYHFVIRRNGVIEAGRPTDTAGAHCYGQNSYSIGTCLIGRDNFTREQFVSLRIIDDYLRNVYNKNLTSHGHREFSNSKSCPNFNVSHVLGCE